jgi:hypothetical protein
MTTKSLEKIDSKGLVLAVKRPRRTPAAPRQPGRPSRPWLKPRIRVPHPVHPQLLEEFVTQEQAALWTGRSRQTVARWAEAGQCPDKALETLLALYAHGMPPIPPDSYSERNAREWAAFRLRRDFRRKGAPWVLCTPYSSATLGWAEIDAYGEARRLFEGVAMDLQRWRDRALAAEAEAARLADRLAYQC